MGLGELQPVNEATAGRLFSEELEAVEARLNGSKAINKAIHCGGLFHIQRICTLCPQDYPTLCTYHAIYRVIPYAQAMGLVLLGGG
jgi:hypothetical protein